MTLIIDFSDPLEVSHWHAINDGVMGGLSQSALIQEPGRCVFCGQISLQHNGGFASVRRESAHYALQEATGLRLRLRGDGRQYQLRLRTDTLFDGVAYRALLATEPQCWQEIELEWHQFEPLFRGRIVAGAPPLDPLAVRQIGLMTAEKREGSFRLELESLRVY